jgi:hypothetical protein
VDAVTKLLVTGAVTLALVCAGTASAANQPDPRLDAAASLVAGHPISVYCENDWATWLANTSGPGESGFTVIGTPVVYVDPQVCLTLQIMLHGDDAGSVYGSQALLTLAHESVHQRGITDEGVTDCTALPFVPQLATKFFGIPATVQQTVTATRTILVRIGSKSKRISVTYTKEAIVPNPFLTTLATQAELWHRASPPEYQGGC